jgi:hypothetical protein
MASRPTILGNSHLLAAIGTALLQIKNEDRLTLADMGSILGRSDEMVAQYIAGEAEMGVTVWFRAQDAWGERLEAKLGK